MTRSESRDHVISALAKPALLPGFGGSPVESFPSIVDRPELLTLLSGLSDLSEVKQPVYCVFMESDNRLPDQEQMWVSVGKKMTGIDVFNGWDKFQRYIASDDSPVPGGLAIMLPGRRLTADEVTELYFYIGGKMEGKKHDWERRVWFVKPYSSSLNLARLEEQVSESFKLYDVTSEQVDGHIVVTSRPRQKGTHTADLPKGRHFGYSQRIAEGNYDVPGVEILSRAEAMRFLSESHYPPGDLRKFRDGNGHIVRGVCGCVSEIEPRGKVNRLATCDLESCVFRTNNPEVVKESHFIGINLVCPDRVCVSCLTADHKIEHLRMNSIILKAKKEEMVVKQEFNCPHHGGPIEERIITDSPLKFRRLADGSSLPSVEKEGDNNGS